jgi:hypothetical protein
MAYPDPMERHSAEVAALRQAVLETPGATDRATREAAYAGGGLPPQLDAYVASIDVASYRITDGDIARLLAADQSEDAVFELTLAAAIGAAGRRLEAGLRALRAAD